MTDGLKWTVNHVPGSDDKFLDLMSEENVKKANEFHKSFPQYSVTPLQNLSSLAKYLGVKNVDFIKDIDGVKDEKDNVLLENKFINEISYEKALEKALLNKMPISYDAIVLAKEFDIKIIIKNRENSLLCIIK